MKFWLKKTAKIAEQFLMSGNFLPLLKKVK
jgi:hypothetical protein